MNTNDFSALIKHIWRVNLDLAAYKLDSIQRLGLTPHDVHAIATLADFGAMTASDLAARLGVTSGAVTGIVDRLIKAGGALRDVDPRDRRRHIIRLQRSGLDDILGDLTTPALQRLASYTAEELGVIRKYVDDLDQLIHQTPKETRGDETA